MFLLIGIVICVALALAVGVVVYLLWDARQADKIPRQRTEFENTAIRLASEILAAEKYGWTGIPDEVLAVAHALNDQAKDLR